jgi:hypothetical protein
MSRAAPLAIDESVDREPVDAKQKGDTSHAPPGGKAVSI